MGDLLYIWKLFQVLSLIKFYEMLKPIKLFCNGNFSH